MKTNTQTCTPRELFGLLQNYEYNLFNSNYKMPKYQQKAWLELLLTKAKALQESENTNEN